jgi:hypothetical protein
MAARQERGKSCEEKLFAGREVVRDKWALFVGLMFAKPYQ